MSFQLENSKILQLFLGSPKHQRQRSLNVRGIWLTEETPKEEYLDVSFVPEEFSEHFEKKNI